MTLRASIRVKVLKALRACDGIPMPEESLTGAVLPFVAGARDGDVIAELKDLERDSYVASEGDPITGIRSYTLTTKGALAAKQL